MWNKNVVADIRRSFLGSETWKREKSNGGEIKKGYDVSEKREWAMAPLRAQMF